MPDQVTYIDTRSAARKLLLLLPLVLVLAGAWFAVRWYLGDTIAENLDPDNRGIETARLAMRLAPDDPLAHWRLAELELTTLPPDQINQAIAEYEQAVKLAPNDYRFWLSLGRALEQSGDAAKGERAMRRAVELAPSYSYPHWYLGNLLLRNGDPTAFAELRLASEADTEFRPQVFSLAWQVYRQSSAELTSAIGPSVAARAQFARYLVDGGQVDEGLRMWNGLNANQKKESEATGQAIMQTLLGARHFRRALELWNDLASEDAERLKLAQIVDGGCEQSTAVNNQGPFGWQIKSTNKVQATFDTGNNHSGARSLRIVFQASGKVEFNVSQLVTIEPGAEYDLECFLKTYNLASAGTPVVQVIDGADGVVLGASKPAPPDNNDWQPIAITFKTGPKAEAVVIRIGRASCGETAECPIFGTVWYDDFSLKRRSPAVPVRGV